MSRFVIAAACLVLCSVFLGAREPAGSTGFRYDIGVLKPVEGNPWSGDRMRGARERPKDLLPGRPA
jgi:hypothetical protein